jgi:hypothetical protein
VRIPVKPNGIPKEAEQRSRLKANTVGVATLAF